MPVANLLKSATGTCPICHQKAEIITRAHRGHQAVFQPGWNQMVGMAAEADRSHRLDEKSLRPAMAEIDHRFHVDGDTICEALKEGWKRSNAHAVYDVESQLNKLSSALTQALAKPEWT